MEPPNASSDSPSQLEVTQVTEQLSTMPSTQQLASNPTPSHERIIQNHAFLTTPDIGSLSDGQDADTTKEVSYLSGTTVENTPGVYQDILMGLRCAGTPGDLNVNAGGREGELVLSGVFSSSPPVSTLPGFYCHREGGGDVEEVGGFGDDNDDDDDDDGGEREGIRDGSGDELPRSLSSGLRGGFSAERGGVEIPDSEGIEDEFLDGPGPETPRRVGGSGEEETVVDTPFVELVAFTDGVAGFSERGGLVEGALLTAAQETQEKTQKDDLDDSQEQSIRTTDTKETESEIQQESQESAIYTTNTIAVTSGLGDSEEIAVQATDKQESASEFQDESQEQAIQLIDTKDDEGQEPVIQSTTESEFGVLGSLEPAMPTISDSSGQVSEAMKELLEVTGLVDSSKDGLSEIVCQTLFISPDEHTEPLLVNSTAEEEIDSIGIKTSTTNLKDTTIIEDEVPKEELHSEATEATTFENSEPDDFGYLDPTVTMELPTVVSLSDEDVHPKYSSDNEEDETPFTNASNAGIGKPSSEKLDPDVFDPLENDVISQDLEVGSTTEMAYTESSSRGIDLPTTMLPLPPPFSSANIEATPKEDEHVMATMIEPQDVEATPPTATLLLKQNAALQDQGTELEDETTDNELSKNGVNSPISALLPQEVTTLEGLGMTTGAGLDIVEAAARVEKIDDIENHPGSGEILPDREKLPKEDNLPVSSREVDTPDNEPTLPTAIVLPSQDILEDTRSGFPHEASRSIRRTEIPDSDISLEDEESIIEDQNLAVKGTGDGVSGQLEMYHADTAMEDVTDVATSIKELENDGYNSQVGGFDAVADGDSRSNPAVEAKIQPSETRSQITQPDSEETKLTGKIIDEKAPVPVLAAEATVETQSSESLAQPKEDLAQPRGLVIPEKATSLSSPNSGEDLKSALPPTSLHAEKLEMPPTADQVFQPGTTKLQVQKSESVQARPNQKPKENITTCKVIVIPASSESQLTDPPSSSSSSSIQQPSTVVDIPPIAPPSLKATRQGSKKRTSISVEELPSPSKSDIPSSPPQKKPRVEDASPTKVAEEEKSPAKNKDEILLDELKAMKVASIQSRNSNLELEISRIKEKLEAVRKELKNPAAETVKTHIHLLHQYNDIRDVGQGLIGMIAENRGVRIGELYEEFGVGLKD